MTSYYPFPLDDLDIPHPKVSEINAFQRGWRLFCGPTPDVRRIVSFINMVKTMLSDDSCSPNDVHPPNADPVPNRQWGTIGCEIMTLNRVFADNRDCGHYYGEPIMDMSDATVVLNSFRSLNISVDPQTCTVGRFVDFHILDDGIEMMLTQIREVPGYYLFFLAVPTEDGKYAYHDEVISLSSFVERYHDVEILSLSY